MVGCVDRRFVCRECGTKWFIHEHLVDEPDLVECGRCGGRLVKFANGSGHQRLRLGDAAGSQSPRQTLQTRSEHAGLWKSSPMGSVHPTAAAKAIAHPLRANILEKLDGRSSSASELAAELDQPIPNVAYHLMILQDLGAIRVTGRRRGRGSVERFFTATWRVRLVAEEIDT